MSSMTTSHQDYSRVDDAAQRDERVRPVKPRESHILESQATFDATTVSHEDYRNGAGDRFETRRPIDSDFLKGDDSFHGETQYSRDFPVSPVPRMRASPKVNHFFNKVSCISFH